MRWKVLFALLGLSGMAAPMGVIAPQEAQMMATWVEDQEAGHVVAVCGPSLMKIPGVWGVQDRGKPNGRIVIRVDVEKTTPEIESKVPQTLGNFPVEIFVGPAPVEDSLEEHLPSSGAEENATQASQPQHK
jgi:hypothetical protein